MLFNTSCFVVYKQLLILLHHLIVKQYSVILCNNIILLHLPRALYVQVISCWVTNKWLKLSSFICTKCTFQKSINNNVFLCKTHTLPVIWNILCYFDGNLNYHMQYRNCVFLLFLHEKSLSQFSHFLKTVHAVFAEQVF